MVDAILVDDSLLEISLESINFIGAEGQSSFYDGSLSQLGIERGILLTSGTGNPPLENTSTGFGISQLGNTDEDLQNVANSAFTGNGMVQDANILEFSFIIENPNVDSISFDLIFGSEEFPEFADSSFGDIAAVFVNGQNVAFFNNDVAQPLSVTNDNLSAGNFIDNGDGILPIEYDGISSVLNIVAPVEQGENTIKFGVADTGDGSNDSGLFISNFTTEVQPILDSDDVIDGTNGDDTLIAGNGNNVITAGDGNDIINSGGGNDTVDGGSGNDLIEGSSGDDLLNGNNGDDTLLGGSGNNFLIGGGGSDLFVLDIQGTARIEDFNSSQDSIGISGASPNDLTFEVDPSINQTSVLFGDMIIARIRGQEELAIQQL